MTVQTAYVIQADSYSAQNFRNAINSLLGPAARGLSGGTGGVVNTGDLAVTAGSGNSVNVAEGECWVGANQGSAQGLYYCYNDATVNLGITPSVSTIIYAIITMSVNDQAYSGNPGVPSNTAGLMVTQGTSPPATPANSLLLASISVPISASSSAAYTITDERVSSQANPAGRMYAETTATSIPDSTVTNILHMVTDFALGGVEISSSAITVPVAGIYRVDFYVSYVDLVSSAGNCRAQLEHDSDYVRECFSFGDEAYPVTAGGSDLIIANANDTFRVAALQYTGYTQTNQIGIQYGTYLSVALDQETP
jgi:hypothetical protein